MVEGEGRGKRVRGRGREPALARENMGWEAAVALDWGREPWFSQSYFPQKGIWWRDRGLEEFCED